MWDAEHRLEQVEYELEELRDQLSDRDTTIAELEDENTRLEAESSELHATVEQLEARINDPTELEVAAKRLCALLRHQFGCERFDESTAVHDIFRAIEDVEDALRPPVPQDDVLPQQREQGGVS